MNGTSSYRRILFFASLVAAAVQLGMPVALSAQTRSVTAPLESMGTTYADLSARWWQWILSIPADVNPNLDANGENCKQGQTGTVWFLAGSFGGQARRACTIPAGRALFFPVLNNLAFAPRSTETVLDLRRLAEAPIIDATVLECVIDGESIANLSDYRVASPAFSTLVRPGGLLTPKFYDPMVSDGIWILVPPLPKGRHTIAFRAVTGAFTVDVAYDLTIE